MGYINYITNHNHVISCTCHYTNTCPAVENQFALQKLILSNEMSGDHASPKCSVTAEWTFKRRTCWRMNRAARKNTESLPEKLTDSQGFCRPRPVQTAREFECGPSSQMQLFRIDRMVLVPNLPNGMLIWTCVECSSFAGSCCIYVPRKISKPYSI